MTCNIGIWTNTTNTTNKKQGPRTFRITWSIFPLMIPGPKFSFPYLNSNSSNSSNYSNLKPSKPSERSSNNSKSPNNSKPSERSSNNSKSPNNDDMNAIYASSMFE